MALVLEAGKLESVALAPAWGLRTALLLTHTWQKAPPGETEQVCQCGSLPFMKLSMLSGGPHPLLNINCFPKTPPPNTTKKMSEIRFPTHELLGVQTIPWTFSKSLGEECTKLNCVHSSRPQPFTGSLQCLSGNTHSALAVLPYSQRCTRKHFAAAWMASRFMASPRSNKRPACVKIRAVSNGLSLTNVCHSEAQV